MLNIKPVLHVDENGALIPMAKINGRKKGMRYLVQKLSERAENLNDQTVYIVHGDCLEDAIRLKAMIEQELGVTKLEIVELGPVVGSHTGRRHPCRDFPRALPQLMRPLRLLRC